MATLFDIRSLGLSAVVLALSLAAAMGVLYQNGQRDRKLLYWAAAGLCFTMAMGTLAFFWEAPRHVRLWCGNFPFLVGLLLVDLGFLRHLGRPLSWLGVVSLLGAAALATLFPALFLATSTMVFSLFFGSALGWGAWLLLHAESPELRGVHRLLSAILGSFLLAFLFRFLLALSTGSGQRAGSPSSLSAVFTYVVAVAFLALLQLGLMALVHREQTLALERLVRIDPLTGLGNRRSLGERGAVEWERARRFGEPLSLVLMDLDHFKSINDRHGHAAGDAVLAHFGELVRGRLRSIDHVFRIGGEEFLLLLPKTDLAGAGAMAEALRRVVAESPCPTPGGTLPFTVSLGVGTARADDGSWEMLLQRVDAALYRAKEGGRNRVVFDH